MRKLPILLLLAIFSVAQTGIAEAGITLKVKYNIEIGSEDYEITREDLLDDEDNNPFTSRVEPIGSAESRIERMNLFKFAKSKAGFSKLTAFCKMTDAYKARVKVIDARGGTAGLGNLKVVSVTDISIVSITIIDMVPIIDISIIEDDDLPKFQGYVREEGVWHAIEYTCQFSGSVSLISSNAYRIFINGMAGPEFTKQELTKMKWDITL